MKYWRSCIVGSLLVVALLAGCAGPRKTADVIDQDQIREAAFFTYWQAQMPLTKGDRIEEGYLVDDNLYLTTAKGFLYTVQADEGLLRWHTKLTESDYTIFPPQHLSSRDGHGPLLVTTTTSLHIIDRYSGEQIFTEDLQFPQTSAAVGDGSRLYVGGQDDNMYSLLWKHPFGEGTRERWRLSTGSPVSSTPILVNTDLLVYATANGRVVSVGALEKTGNWIFNAGPIVSSPTVDSTSVYIASLDRSVYRIDLSTGELLWQYRLPSPLREKPIVIGFTCFQACSKKGVTAIDIDSGTAKWQRADGVKTLAGFGGEVALLTKSGRVEIVDIETGETSRSFGASDAVAIAVNVQDDAVYAATADGRVISVRPSDTPYLRIQEVAASRNYVNQPKVEREEEWTPSEDDEEKGLKDPFRSRYDK